MCMFISKYFATFLVLCAEVNVDKFISLLPKFYTICFSRLDARFFCFVLCLVDSDEGADVDSGGLRRSCSLSDLANPSPRRVLHSGPVQGMD